MKVGLLTDLPGLDRAFALAFEQLGTAAFVPLARLRDVESGMGLILDCGDELDRHGNLSRFYALRAVLCDSPPVRLGPIALFGLEPRLFASPEQKLPEAERIRYFPVPFLVAEMIEFVQDPTPPADRRFTRLFLRERLTAEILRAIERGDHHCLAHFSSLTNDLEVVLAGGDRNRLACSLHPDMRGLFYTNKALAAAGMVDEAVAIASRQGVPSDTAASITRLRRVLEKLETLSRLLDAATADGQHEGPAWDALDRAVARAAELPVRALHQQWLDVWGQLARRISEPPNTA